MTKPLKINAMNVPHDKICPDCGSYMDWYKDHYECPKCGHIGRKMYRWLKKAVVLFLLIGLVLFLRNFVMI